MSVTLTKEDHTQAITSIQRYFEENMDEPIGNIAASALLEFFLAEIGPAVYNKAVADAQERLQARVMELDMEVHEALPVLEEAGRCKQGSQVSVQPLRNRAVNRA